MSSSNGFWNLVFFVIAINSLKGALLNFLDDAPIVSTRLGKICGKYGRMSSGDACYMFRGIRYAQSPVNELRFMVYYTYTTHFKINSKQIQSILDIFKIATSSSKIMVWKIRCNS